MLKEYFVGDGSKENPFLVATPGQLSNIRNHLDKHFKQIAHIDLYREGPNGEPMSWEPIGDFFKNSDKDNHPFTGSYDGNGYKIKQLTINRKASRVVGLFGYIGEGGHIKKISIEDANVIGKDAVGVIAGMNDGIIEMCGIKEADIKGNRYVGGVAGINNNILKNILCGNNNVRELREGVSKNEYSFIEGSEFIGGLAGINDGKIKNSLASISIKDKGSSKGIVGINNGDIKTSFYNADMTNRNTKNIKWAQTTYDLKKKSLYKNWDLKNVWYKDEGEWSSFPKLIFQKNNEQDQCCEFAGGDGTENNPNLIANKYHFFNVRNRLDSYFKQINDIKATYKNWTPIGLSEMEDSKNMQNFEGFYNGNNYNIGYFYLNEDCENEVGIFGCVGENGKLTNITVNTVQYSNMFDTEIIGGLVGHNKGEIKDCKVEEAFISGRKKVGGMIGYNQGKVIDCSISSIELEGEIIGGLVGFNKGDIDNSFSKGFIDGEKNGGLVGHHKKGIIHQCYSGVNNHGGDVIGGLVGLNDSEIRESSAFGNVEGITNTGGLIGSNNGKIVNCYVENSPTPAYYNNSYYFDKKDSFKIKSKMSALGDFIGVNTGIVKYSYANGNSDYSEVSPFIGEDKNGQVISSYYTKNDNAKDLSDAKSIKKTEKIKKEFYKGWDFEEVWLFMNEETFPGLQWEQEVIKFLM